MGKAYCFYQNYREVRLLVIHCSATRYDRDFPVEAPVHHTRHGDSPISGIISISHGTGNYTAADRSTRSGRTQPDGTTKVSVYVTRGGLDEQGRPTDTRTYAQRCTLMDLLRQLRRDYPEARILGHYQLSPYIKKACPCFDARKEYETL